MKSNNDKPSEILFESYEESFEHYESKARTTEISVSCRMSTKVYEDFHTVEYYEKRALSDVSRSDLDKERKLLWQEAREQLDAQIDGIYESYRKLY